MNQGHCVMSRKPDQLLILAVSIVAFTVSCVNVHHQPGVFQSGIFTSHNHTLLYRILCPDLFDRSKT